MRLTWIIPYHYCKFIIQNVTKFSLHFLPFYLSSLILRWSVWFYFPGRHYSGCKHTQSFSHSKCIVILTGAWLEWVFRGWCTYFIIHSPHFSTFFAPILNVFWCFVQWWGTKGDNASWVEILTFLFSCLAPCTVMYNGLSFSHFYIHIFYL